MKNTLLLSLVTFLFCYSANAQWYPDTPTPAEIQARDLPYKVLQDQLGKALPNNIWNLSPFKYYKDNPEKRNMIRGKGIHYFDFSLWDGDYCEITLKPGTPEHNAIMDSLKIINEKLNLVMGDISALMQESFQKLQENGGKTTGLDHKRIQKDSLLKVHYMSAVAHQGNKLKYCKIRMSLNVSKEDGIGSGGSDYLTDSIVTLQLPGVKQGVLRLYFPNNTDPEMPDTLYSAQLYIGDWKKMTKNQKTDFVFKYEKKDGWLDKAHSGQPIIENIGIYFEASNYNYIMNLLKNVDWTKLEALVKK